MRDFFQSRIFAAFIVAAVIAVIIYGIFVSGSPATQRALQFDEARISALQQISVAIDQYWERNNTLPENLEILQDSRYYYVSSVEDPETALAYEYEVLGEKKYELCATFELSSKENKAALRFASRAWEYEAGRTCFELEVQPRIAPQID